MVLASVPAAEGAGWPEQLPLLPHPGEMVIGLIAFAILYWVYAKYVVPKMEELYAERAAAIEGGMQQAEEAQAQAQAALDKYTAQLNDARAEANEIREEAREQGAAYVADMRAQAQAEADRITEAAQRQVEAERQQAATSLRRDVGTISTDLASKIVGESLEDEVRQKGLVDRFLSDLEAGEIAPAAAGANGQDA